MISFINTPSSSSIQGYGYDRENNTLAIRFHTGKLYHYHKVPEKVYNMLLAADSAGQYINKHIKNSFNYTAITEKKNEK